MDPTVVLEPDRSLPALVIAGLSIRTNNNEAASTIPALWQRVFARGLPSIRGAVPFDGGEIPLLALYDQYESDHRGPYSLTVGVPIDPQAKLDPDLIVRTVPALRYAAVRASGPSPATIFAAWSFVWKELTPRRSFVADLEVYRPSAGEHGPIELLISVR